MLHSVLERFGLTNSENPIELLKGFVHIIAILAAGLVTLHLTRDWARAVVDFTVPQPVEIWNLFRVLETTGALLANYQKGSILDRPELLGIENLSDEGARVRLAVKTLPSCKAVVSREWRRFILETPEHQGIELVTKR